MYQGQKKNDKTGRFVGRYTADEVTTFLGWIEQAISKDDFIDRVRKMHNVTYRTGLSWYYKMKKLYQLTTNRPQ